MTSSNPAEWPEHLRRAFADLVLAGADDDFLIGHGASEWTGLAPMLEEDIAFSSIAQDEIAHARELYALTGDLLGRTADDVAYGRWPDEYRCSSLVVRADEFDWSALIARQFYYDHFDALRLARWRESGYAPLADLSLRIAAEETFHLHHVDDWLVRLGRGGSQDARQKIQAALEAAWPDAVSQFEETAGVADLAASGLWPGGGGATALFGEYKAMIADRIARAGLRMPAGGPDPAHLPPGGRRGRHASRLAEVLDELCEVYRLEPNAKW